MSEITSLLSKKQTRYVVKERLGRGGMATVFRAEDTNLRRDVAIKVLHEYLTDDDTFRQRFELEAQIIAGYNHPNIVQVYDFDTLEGDDSCIYYMVMRYIDGETLVDVLDQCRTTQKSLSHERVASIISDVAQALDYAHDRDMIHRDIKPANILMEKNGRAILSDFGIARLAQERQSNLTQDGSIIGTPAYMAPEQAAGQMVDYRSDLYALGVVLFELLTGQPPFQHESTLRLLSMHATAQPPAVSSIMPSASDQLDEVLFRALAKDPNERYQSGKALVAALNKAFGEEALPIRQRANTLPDMPVEKPAPARRTDTQVTVFNTIETVVIRPIKRNPFGFAAFAIALVALLIVARITQDLPNAPDLPTPPSAATSPTEAVASSMTEGDMFFSSGFDEGDSSNLYWTIQDNDMLRTSIDTEVSAFILENRMPDTAPVSLVDEVYIYNDAMITLTGTLDDSASNSASAFGIVFRYQDNDNYNVFAIDGRGRYSIWTRQDGSWRELRGADTSWQPDDNVNPIGEQNQLTVTIQGEIVSADVNGVEVVSLTEATFEDGNIGIYIATTDNAGAITTVQVDSFSVSEPVAESMTGDSPAESMTGDEESPADSMTGE